MTLLTTDTPYSVSATLSLVMAMPRAQAIFLHKKTTHTCGTGRGGMGLVLVHRDLRDDFAFDAGKNFFDGVAGDGQTMVFETNHGS